MPRTAISRLFSGSICSSCRTKIRHNRLSAARSLSTTTRKHADSGDNTLPPRPQRPTSTLTNLFSEIRPDIPRDGRAGNVSRTLGGMQQNSVMLNSLGSRKSRGLAGSLDSLDTVVPSYPSGGSMSLINPRNQEPHHFHIYCTKHNTHICLTRPNREPIISFSSGNIGFRKAQRGSYDAGFQLAAYVMKMIQDRGLLRMAVKSDEETTSRGKGQEKPIQTLEVVVRGFGKGRDAVVKALLGNEGRSLRGKVVKISDATRLKFGGTRSPNPRRLG